MTKFCKSSESFDRDWVSFTGRCALFDESMLSDCQYELININYSHQACRRRPILDKAAHTSGMCWAGFSRRQGRGCTA